MPLCDTCGIVQASAEMRRRKNRDAWFCKDRQPCDMRAADGEDFDNDYEIKTRKPRGKDVVEISYRKKGTGRFKRFTVMIFKWDSRKKIEERAVQLVRQHATGRMA